MCSRLIESLSFALKHARLISLVSNLDAHRVAPNTFVLLDLRRASGFGVDHLMAISRTMDRFHPSVALRPGTADARVVLGLWCLRKSFLPLMWLGLSIAVLGFEDADAFNDRLAGLADPGDVFASLLSPMAGVVVAFGVRIGVGLMALVSAYPFASATSRADHLASSRVRGLLRLWWDRLYIARAFRSLRWTWAVRQTAAERLGQSGRLWMRCATWIRWSGFVLLLVFLFVVGNTGV